jgi:hypothetical protein
MALGCTETHPVRIVEMAMEARHDTQRTFISFFSIINISFHQIKAFANACLLFFYKWPTRRIDHISSKPKV